MVDPGGEFHADLFFGRWAIDHELLPEREVLGAPCHRAIKRPAKRHYLSDSKFEAAGEFYVGKSVFGRYNLLIELTAELEEEPIFRRPVPSESICSSSWEWLWQRGS